MERTYTCAAVSLRWGTCTYDVCSCCAEVGCMYTCAAAVLRWGTCTYVYVCSWFAEVGYMYVCICVQLPRCVYGWAHTYGVVYMCRCPKVCGQGYMHMCTCVKGGGGTMPLLHAHVHMCEAAPRCVCMCIPMQHSQVGGCIRICVRIQLPRADAHMAWLHTAPTPQPMCVGVYGVCVHTTQQVSSSSSSSGSRMKIVFFDGNTFGLDSFGHSCYACVYNQGRIASQTHAGLYRHAPLEHLFSQAGIQM